jgi:hypothetical protein
MAIRRRRTHQLSPVVREVNARADELGRAVHYTLARDPAGRHGRLVVKQAVVMTHADTMALRRDHKLHKQREKVEG